MSVWTPRDWALPQVVVHDLAQARGALAAAAACGVRIELRSAPEAAGYAGVGYLKSLGALAGQELVIDCGDDPGLAMAALRTGCRRLAFAGAPETARRLGEMAEQVGASLVHETGFRAALVLAPEDDAARACRAWLRPREA
jgi:hypothetical protein